MHLFRASLVGAFWALALAGPVGGDSLSLDPEAQLKRDQSDCRRWATLHTGFDPRNTTSSEAPNPHQTVPVLKSVPGAASHGFAASALRDDERRRSARMARKQQVQDEADLEDRRAVYERAVRTCLEGRNHSSNDHSAALIGEPAARILQEPSPTK